MFILEQSRTRLNSIDFSPDGSTLATGGAWGVIQLWDLETRTLNVKVTTGHVSISTVAFAADGKLYASTYGSLLRIEPSLGTFARANDRDSWCFAVSPDRMNLCVVCGYENTTLALYALPRLDADRWSHQTDLSHKPALAYSADGRFLATGNPYGLVQVRQVATGKVSAEPVAVGRPISSIATSPDGGQVAFCAGTHVHLWRVEPAKEVAHHRFGRTHFLGVAWHPSGEFFATCNGDGKVDYWDGRTGQSRESFGWGADKLTNITFDAGGDRAACCGATGKIVVWDVDH